MGTGSTNYPADYDDDYTLVSDIEKTNEGEGHSGRHNDHYKAVEAIQKELGQNPADSVIPPQANATVGDRITLVENNIDNHEGRLDTLEVEQIPNTIVTAKGDLLVGSAPDTVVALPVGPADPGDVLTVNPGGDDVIWAAPTGGGAGGHTIEDPADVDMTQRTNLKFDIGFQVVDSQPSDRTTVAPDFGTAAGKIAEGDHNHDAAYVNEADHDKTAHDALNIDADTLDGLDSADFVQQTEVGAVNGIAELDAGQKVPLAQLPSIGTGTITYVIAAEANLVDFNEIQTFKFGIANGSASDPTGGTFTLSFDGQGPTVGIAYDAVDTVVESALEGLSNIGVGDVNVVKSGQGDYIVNFQGALAGTNVAELTSDGTSLTGPNSPYTIAHATTLAGTNLSDGETAYAIAEQTLWVWDNTGSSWELFIDGTAGGAPSGADYLVGTANGSLSNEIIVGVTPGGELGGTWASPTVDATHAGSTHLALGTSPSNQVFGDVAAGGAASDAAKTDHKHGMPAITDSTGTTSSTTAASATAVKSAYDTATGKPSLTVNNPSTQAFGDSAVVGVGTAASKDDHKHAMPANPVTAHEAASDPHSGYVLESLLDAKGDIIAASANDTPAKVTVGTNNQVLTADSAQTAGVKWSTLTASSVGAVGTGDAAGGQLTGTYPNPSVASSHSGSTHAATQAAAEATASGALSTHAAAVTDIHSAAGYIRKSQINAKGDLFVGSADDTVGILSAGAAATVLSSDGSGNLSWTNREKHSYITTESAAIGNTKTFIKDLTGITPVTGDIIRIRAIGYIDNPPAAPSTPDFHWYIDWNPDNSTNTELIDHSITCNQDGSSQTWSLDANLVVTAATTVRIMSTISNNLRSDSGISVAVSDLPGLTNFSGQSGAFEFWVKGRDASAEKIVVQHATLQLIR